MSAQQSRHPAAVASLSLAVTATIALSTLGTNFTHQSLWYSGLAATALVLCSGAIGLIAIRRFIYQGISIHWQHVLCLVGASLSLVSGCATLIARQLGFPSLHSLVTLASFYAMPIAAILCLAGGISLIPRQAGVPVLGLMGGALATGYISLGPDHLLTRAGVGASALVTLFIALWVIWQQRGLISAPSWLFRLGSAILIMVMTYALTIAVTPSSWWASYAPPQALALSYILAALSGLAGGLTYRQESHRPPTA